MKKYEELLPMKLQYFAEDEGESEGVNESVVAEQTESEGEVSNETEGENEAPTEPQFDTEKANAAFARYRRENEALSKELQRYKELDAYVARQFGSYKNPETGQSISGLASYFEGMSAQERMQTRQQLQESNIDPSIIDRAIATSPVVRQAEAAMAELNNTRAQQQMEKDIQDVLKLDPSIASKEALMSDPSMPAVLEKVRTGMNLVDAYKIVNFDRLASSRTAAAKQSVVNQVKGQAHLSNGTSVTVTETEEDIPANMLQTFKDQFPEKSMKELKSLYNKVMQSRR